MELICIKSCLDKDNLPFNIGNHYKYYDSEYVFDMLDNKIYDIYEELDGKDIYKGNGSLQFINNNFEIKGEIVLTKLICKDVCIGPNGRKYYKDKHYYFSIKEVPYNEGEPKQYVMYDEQKVWLGYVKRKFIRKNFIEWGSYVNEFFELDELFEKMMYE